MQKTLEFLEDIKKVLQSLISIWKLLQKHGVFFLLVGILAALIGFAYYWSFIKPSEAISRFYGSIDRRDFASAWDLMDPGLHKRWNGGLAEFAKDYDSTVVHQIHKVEHVDAGLGKIPSALFAHSALYEVEVLAEDRFTGDILQQPTQAFNERWLRLRHPNADIDAIKKGERTKDNESSLPMKRRFKLEVTVKREVSGWKIASFRWREVGLVWRTDK